VPPLDWVQSFVCGSTRHDHRVRISLGVDLDRSSDDRNRCWNRPRCPERQHIARSARLTHWGFYQRMGVIVGALPAQRSDLLQLKAQFPDSGGACVHGLPDCAHCAGYWGLRVESPQIMVTVVCTVCSASGMFAGINDDDRVVVSVSRTLTGLSTEVAHLRTAVEALAEGVKRHEEQLRKLTKPPPRR
jgi:hypothetical protein